jgi:ubiquitin-protein ligase
MNFLMRNVLRQVTNYLSDMNLKDPLTENKASFGDNEKEEWKTVIEKGLADQSWTDLVLIATINHPESLSQ